MNNLNQILESRILVIDSAIGKMLQSYNLTEEDFKNKKFLNHHKDLIGNNSFSQLSFFDKS